MSNPEKDLTSRDPSKVWETGAFNRETNEWVYGQLRSWDNRPTQEELAELLIRQAPPVRVNATRRKRPDSASRAILLFGDTHHPFQNDRRLDLAMIAIRELAPERIVFTGDDLDMSQFSKFEQRPEWAGSTQEGIDRFTTRLARVVAEAGRLAIVDVLQGNHDFRLERELRKYNQELMGLRQAGEPLPAMSLEFLLRCNDLGVNYHSGYPEAEVWPTDDFFVYHGRKTSQSSVIALELKNAVDNFAHGHGHRGELLYRTLRYRRTVRTIFGMQVGTFADLSKAPSGLHSVTEKGDRLVQAQNWDSTLGVVFVHEDGSLEPHLLTISDDGIDLFGRRYRS